MIKISIVFNRTLRQHYHVAVYHSEVAIPPSADMGARYVTVAHKPTLQGFTYSVD
jgi:hypothetical protein